jgi:hypothetical protein
VRHPADGGFCNPGDVVTHEETFDWPATTTLSWIVGEPVDGGGYATDGDVADAGGDSADGG